MTVIDDYLAGVPAAQRKLLEDLRKEMKRLLPKAEETISYGLPCFKVEGGVITEVKPIEDKAPAVPAAQMAELKAELAAVKAEAESLKAQFAAQVEAAKQMFNVVSILAGSPAEAETEQKKKVFTKADPNDIAQKLAVALSKLNPTN